MAVHVAPPHLTRRQASSLGQPTTLSNTFLTSASLVLDTQMAPGSSPTSFDLVSGSPPVITTTVSPTSTPTTDTSTTSPSAASGSSNPIPLSTVIGACVGAFIGAALLILIGVWLYRRYAMSLKRRAQSRRALGRSRNINGEQGRRRSHLEPWNKLEEGDDKWEGMYQTKEVANVAPMEKLTMFKKSPSIRTAYTHKSDEPGTFDTLPFVQYHPNIAAELASGENKTAELPIARQFLGRVDTGPAISWDGETIGDDSFLSIRSGLVSGSAPTPPPTVSKTHRWESAEVIQYENPGSDVNPSPAVSAVERRKSANNPFFNASDHTRPRSNSTRSRSNSTRSHSTIKADTTTPKVNKGKGRAMDDDPFTDDLLPRPFIPAHFTSSSQSSSSSNDRALQSLIAALDLTEEDIQERLRVASMQPSVISATSAYTSAGEDEDVTGSFPLPPSIDNGHRAGQ